MAPNWPPVATTSVAAGFGVPGAIVWPAGDF